jgi:transposase InsO family protein
VGCWAKAASWKAMPWKESRAMDLRVQLIEDYQQGESIAALSEIYSISRKTIYKWLARWQSQGMAGLAEQSRAPHHRPQQVDSDTARRIMEARQKWKWGPRKLRWKLQQLHPDIGWPAASTIAELLRSRGLSHPRRKRQHTPLYPGALAEVQQANQTWCADFKGWFRTRDGTRCDPLTITDAHTRFLLRCQITPKTDTLHVQAVFDAAFQEYGLPTAIHTDNGAPFASRAPGGLSRLSMRWVKLGITAERSRPAMPQDNGRHERFHLTLKQETLNPAAAHPRGQQEVFQEFQNIYNFDRPHEALAYRTPASCYVASPRPMPRRVPELEYEAGMEHRRVNYRGDFIWKGQRVFLSEIFGHETVGLRSFHERYYQVLFGPVLLGWLDTYRVGFHRTLSRHRRREIGLQT